MPACLLDWQAPEQSQQESRRDLESGCWFGALSCRSPCPCSHLVGRGVGRTAYLFPVGQQCWVGQRQGGICPFCKHARNRAGREKLEVSGVTEPNRKLICSEQGAGSPLLKRELLEQAREGIRSYKPEWKSEKERNKHLWCPTAVVFAVSLGVTCINSYECVSLLKVSVWRPERPWFHR